MRLQIAVGVAVLLAAAVFVANNEAKIISTYVFPHGGLALDPSHANITNSSAQQLAKDLHDNLVAISTEIATQKPDIIFLTTPHGIADLNNFLLYLNTDAKGIAFAEDCTTKECAYKLAISLAANESMDLVSHLRRSHRVSGISGFGPPGGIPQSQALPLAWGEIIPLYFIPRLKNVKVIVLSYPSRRYNGSREMIPELLHLGRALYLRLQHLSERVIVVTSGDLAHTHSKDGPYGFSPAAQPFDDAVASWLSTLDASALLETAGSLVDEALSCGFPGMVTLHGMLSEGGLKKWQPKLFVIGHPTYYGMAVAGMHRNETTK